MQSYLSRLARAGVVLAVACLGFTFAIAPGVTAQGKTVKDGVYTADQAKRGEAIYQQQCASCHGADLTGGGGGPALAGGEFIGYWDKMPLADLVDKIQTSMPASAPGSLNRKQSTDIVALMLQTSKFPAGQTELSDDAKDLSTIHIVK